MDGDLWPFCVDSIAFPHQNTAIQAADDGERTFYFCLAQSNRHRIEMPKARHDFNCQFQKETDLGENLTRLSSTHLN